MTTVSPSGWPPRVTLPSTAPVGCRIRSTTALSLLAAIETLRDRPTPSLPETTVRLRGGKPVIS
jgi:hypothetical protein